MRSFLFHVTVVVTCIGPLRAQSDFRVPPYVQNPALDASTIKWLSETADAGEIVIGDSDGPIDTAVTTAVFAPQLEYPAWEVNPDDFPDGVVPDPPYLHSARFEGLIGNKEHWYRVTQGSSVFESTFRTAPGIRNPIRFVVYGDSETEPSPVRPFGTWADPADPESNRVYLIDQRTGYAENLAIIRDRDPHFVAIAGDLVQAGGEQRDWDEFWQQNTHGAEPDSSLAGRIPLIPVPGNHEYYSSPHSFSNDTPKEYRQPWSEMAMDRYSTYFELPDNGSAASSGRYFRFDYGPVSIIGVDVSNNGPNQGTEDTNFRLLGDADNGGGNAPSFDPGSEQYEWLEQNLEDARLDRPFVFVLLHYAPYSVGPHGWPAGEDSDQDPLSGVPVRRLTPLFMEYGVDAVFAGHDEIWERSVVDGFEIRPDGSSRPHRIHFYDLGTGGDDLRGPVEGLSNPFQAFLAHNDVPEQWENGLLIGGGKHYGHLEVEVTEIERNVWQAILTPVYAFPVFENDTFVGSERRIYDDIVELQMSDSLRALAIDDGTPTRTSIRLGAAYPNPTTVATTISLESDQSHDVRVGVFDVLGRAVRLLHEGVVVTGKRTLSWDGRNESGRTVPPGMYFIRLEGTTSAQTSPVLVLSR